MERAYRDALSQFPTGVAVVSIFEGRLPLAITINSFSSVSLSPRLVLWSVDHLSNRYEAFRDAEHFSISILGADQQSVAELCAGEALLEKNSVKWTKGENGLPLIADAVARFECQRYSVHPAGDHDIIVGEVTHFEQMSRPALVFHQSNFSQTPQAEG
jgi:flavin reductase (DIM6/NTAB) family NADH-FMN oxidoreductase RutF